MGVCCVCDTSHIHSDITSFRKCTGKQEVNFGITYLFWFESSGILSLRCHWEGNQLVTLPYQGVAEHCNCGCDSQHKWELSYNFWGCIKTEDDFNKWSFSKFNWISSLLNIITPQLTGDAILPKGWWCFLQDRTAYSWVDF